MCLLLSQKPMHVHSIFIWSAEKLDKSMLRNLQFHCFRDINPDQFQIDRRISYLKIITFLANLSPRFFFSNLKSCNSYLGFFQLSVYGIFHLVHLH